MDVVFQPDIKETQPFLEHFGRWTGWWCKTYTSWLTDGLLFRQFSVAIIPHAETGFLSVCSSDFL
jgi:hypothetical protein